MDRSAESSGAGDAAVQLFLLGPFRLESNGHPLPLPPLKVRSLLAYLALYPEPHRREKVAGLFWGDSPDEDARHSLRMALTTMRKLLGRNAILSDRETLQITPDYPLWVDALIFESQARTFLAAALPDPAALDLSLYQGDLLADFYDEWIIPLRERLRLFHNKALHAMVGRWRALGEYLRAIATARRLLELDPADEEAHQHIIFCYLALGDRSAAAQQYAACVRALQEELGVEPSAATVALAAKLVEVAVTPAAARNTNLPTPISSFVGRDAEVEAIVSLLHRQRIRLLTLTGAGGSGKTRLAIAAASELVEPYQDGVWWVELAALEEEALVASAVGRSLGLVEALGQNMEEMLTNYLSSKRLLLVKDNCEHLASACARLAVQLLTHCRDLQILTTSRQSLGASGEHVWPVPTLSCPDPALLPANRSATITESKSKAENQQTAINGGSRGTIPEVIAQSAAVNLFIDRASAQRPGFRLTPDNAADVVQICCRLDGIPLALELAAARVKMLTPQQMVARLDKRFELLSAGSAQTALPHHQTLRATIEWSYNLLQPAEQLLFRRLATFNGGFTLEAAEAICSGKDEGGRMKDEEQPQPSSLILHPSGVFDLLDRLVDKSLVWAKEVGGEMRYGMLETIHAYARERLRETAEASAIHAQHLAYYTALVEEAEPALHGPRQIELLDQLEREHDNLRAALRRSLGTSDVTQCLLGMRMAGALEQFWLRRNYPQEGSRWIEQALALISESTPAAVQAPLYSAGGTIAWLHSDTELAIQRHKQALAAWHTLGNLAGVAIALNNLGIQELIRGNFEQAVIQLEESVNLARLSGESVALGYALLNIGALYFYQQDLERARAPQHEAVANFRTIGDHYLLAHALIGTALIGLEQHAFEQASADLVEALQLAQQVGDVRLQAIVWQTQGHMRWHQQQYAQAIAAYRESLTLLQRTADAENELESLEGLALSLIELGQVMSGLCLLAANGFHRQRLGLPSYPNKQGAIEKVQSRLQSELDYLIFSAAWTRGQAMTLEQAITLALQSSEVSKNL